MTGRRRQGMRVPLELSCVNIAKTDALGALVRKESEKLERVCTHMISCRVSIDKPQKHQRTGSPYRVRIHARVPPGHDLVSKREVGEGDMHEELVSVVRQAFRAMQNQLRGLTEKQCGRVKAHEEQQMTAVIETIVPERGCGFLRTLDGRQIYFHQNSLLNRDFDDLEVGVGVAFSETMGEEGPQASTVRVVENTPRR
jgi:cold shock CspA family protein